MNPQVEGANGNAAARRSMMVFLALVLAPFMLPAAPEVMRGLTLGLVLVLLPMILVDFVRPTTKHAFALGAMFGAELCFAARPDLAGDVERVALVGGGASALIAFGILSAERMRALFSRRQIIRGCVYAAATGTLVAFLLVALAAIVASPTVFLIGMAGLDPLGAWASLLGAGSALLLVISIANRRGRAP